MDRGLRRERLWADNGRPVCSNQASIWATTRLYSTQVDTNLRQQVSVVAQSQTHTGSLARQYVGSVVGEHIRYSSTVSGCSTSQFDKGVDRSRLHSSQDIWRVWAVFHFDGLVPDDSNVLEVFDARQADRTRGPVSRVSHWLWKRLWF